MTVLTNRSYFSPFMALGIASIALFCLFSMTVVVALSPEDINDRADLFQPIIAQPRVFSSVLADPTHSFPLSGGVPQPSIHEMQSMSESNNLSSLFTLNADEIKITSDQPPEIALQSNFFPFGRHLSLSFQLPTTGDQQQAEWANIQSEEQFDIVLEVDQSVVSTDPREPSYSVIGMFFSQYCSNLVKNQPKPTLNLLDFFD